MIHVWGILHALGSDALQVEELEQQLQNTQEELKTERAMGKMNQDAAADEVARAREEIKVGYHQNVAFSGLNIAHKAHIMLFDAFSRCRRWRWLSRFIE
jgi:hypothetical protein